MRVFLLGVMFAVTALLPAAANADDQQIADFIKARLMQEKQQGKLFGFNVDMRVDRGTVWFKGFVSNRDQELMILRTAQLAGHLGVVQVVDDINVNDGTIAQAQPQAPVPTAQPPVPQQQQQQSYQQPQQPYQQPQQVQAPAQPRYAMRPDAYGQIRQGYTPSAEEIRRANSAPGQTLPQPQARPMNPSTQPSFVPSMPTRSRAGVPISESKVPASDENTKVVTYQETIAPSPYQAPAGVPYATPALNPSFQRAPLSPLQTQSISSPIAPPAPISAAPISGPPLPFARAAAPGPAQGCFDGNCGGGGFGGGFAGGGGFGGAAPVPSSGNFGGGPGGISSDNPALPGYAWPAYASHPNYGAVSYPKQYSASAWPYIGPFYPYPQVPLGWRKVSLEWDDGWWFLDFNDKD